MADNHSSVPAITAGSDNSENSQSDENILGISDMSVDYEFSSDRSSSVGSEYQRYCDTVDIDTDIANTHRQVNFRSASFCFRNEGFTVKRRNEHGNPGFLQIHLDPLKSGLAEQS